MTQPPGFLTLTADDYHADLLGDDGPPSLSASIASILVNASPAHARAQHPRLNPDYARDEQKKFDLGRAAHQVLLEGNASVAIVEEANWTTKAAKEARGWARENGLTPLLREQWEGVEAMVAAAREQLAGFDLSPVPFTDGRPEQTIVWSEPNGVTCKARIDWLHDDLSAIDDLKTTSRSANPASWTRKTLYNIGADVQAAFYLRGMERLTGKRPDWRFVVVETFAPFALSVISLGPDVLELANAKVDYAVETWARCLESGEWPAYPQRVCWAEAPAWELSRWLEKEAREEIAA